jgi:hypothetical protein
LFAPPPSQPTSWLLSQFEQRHRAANDPTFGLIAGHAQVYERVRLAEASFVEDRPLISQDEFDDLCSPEMPLFLGLLEVVPTTLAGVVALVTYLDNIREKEPWKFEDNYATPLIGALAKALSRISAEVAT